MGVAEDRGDNYYKMNQISQQKETERWADKCFLLTSAQITHEYKSSVQYMHKINQSIIMNPGTKLDIDILARFAFLYTLFKKDSVANGKNPRIDIDGVKSYQIEGWADGAREQSIRSIDTKPIYLVMAAYHYYKELNYKKSIILCERAIKEQPSLLSSYLLCARSYSELNNEVKNESQKIKNATTGIKYLKIYEKSKKNRNGFVATYIHLHTDLKQFKDAISYLNELINIKSSSGISNEQMKVYIDWKKDLESKINKS